MLTEYIRSALRHAIFEVLADDGSWYAEIPPLRGVWANAQTREECQAELQSVMEDWMLYRLRRGMRLPIIDNIDLNAVGAA